MASALTILFLGCWLAGQSGVSGEGTNLAETQESNPPSTEPEKEEGNNSAETQQPDSHLMDSEGKGGIKPTQPRATPTPAHPGGTGPGGTGLIRPGQTLVPTRPYWGPGGLELNLIILIIVVVSVLVAGLLLLRLLLYLAFLCYRRTRGAGKGPAPGQSSTSPLGVLKTPAQEAPVYSNIDHGKEMQTLPKEPDSGTYAELDRQTLQPSVYDTINMSQGVPQ